MKRALLSLFGGTAITAIGSVLIALPFAPFNRDRIILALLFWPQLLMGKLGLGPDCANADDIQDKLNCVGISLTADLICYGVIIGVCTFLIYRALSRVMPPAPAKTGYVLFDPRDRESI